MQRRDGLSNFEKPVFDLSVRDRDYSCFQLRELVKTFTVNQDVHTLIQKSGSVLPIT